MFKSAKATFGVVAGLAAATIGLGFASNAEARMVSDARVGEFVGVTAIDRYDVDTLLIPFTSGTARVDVVCSTGDYQWTAPITQAAALHVARAWCGY